MYGAASVDLIKKGQTLVPVWYTKCMYILHVHSAYKHSAMPMSQSRELLEILLQLEPDNTRGLGMLGSLEWKAGNPQLARELLMRGIQADPKHVANLHTLARLELEEGHLQEARELFAEGQRLDLNNVYVLQVSQSWCLPFCLERCRALSALAQSASQASVFDHMGGRPLHPPGARCPASRASDVNSD